MEARPNANVWRGNGDIPSTKQGLKILGCLGGHPDCVQDQLSQLSDRHDVLLGHFEMVEVCREHGSCWSMVQLRALISSCCLSAVGNSPLSFPTMMIRYGHVCARCLAWIPPAYSPRIGATHPLRLAETFLANPFLAILF